jgi:hypothetical protein
LVVIIINTQRIKDMETKSRNTVPAPMPPREVTIGEMCDALKVLKDASKLIGNEKVLKMVMGELT